MRFYIVIPAHNEEAFIAQTLNSIVSQTLLPKKVVVVNDNSTDNTEAVARTFEKKYDFITVINTPSQAIHAPGSKVIQAFNKALATLDDEFDVICKFDADIILPDNYLEKLQIIFKENPKVGIAGGFCYILNNNKWVLESLTNKDHVRGALKAYRKKCFFDIGKLKPAMGWDTVDELLAQYHGWKIKTDTSLKVKHLKPTGISYSKKAKYKQGIAFYRLRYGLFLTIIASAKLAIKKQNPAFFINCIIGFCKGYLKKEPFLVSPKEGSFIRSLRYKGVFKKLNPLKFQK